MLKKTAEFSAVFRDKKRDISFIEEHKIGTKSFTRERKLGFDKMMTMIIKKVQIYVVLCNLEGLYAI